MTIEILFIRVLNGYPVSGRLFHLCPIRDGFAVIGRTDNYLSPATVKNISIRGNKLTFILKESGPFAIWLEKGIPKSDNIKFEGLGNGLFTGKLPIETRDCKVEIETYFL